MKFLLPFLSNVSTINLDFVGYKNFVYISLLLFQPFVSTDK